VISSFYFCCLQLSTSTSTSVAAQPALVFVKLSLKFLKTLGDNSFFSLIDAFFSPALQDFLRNQKKAGVCPPFLLSSQKLSDIHTRARARHTRSHIRKNIKCIVEAIENLSLLQHQR